MVCTDRDRLGRPIFIFNLCRECLADSGCWLAARLLPEPCSLFGAGFVAESSLGTEVLMPHSPDFWASVRREALVRASTVSQSTLENAATQKCKAATR